MFLAGEKRCQAGGSTAVVALKFCRKRIVLQAIVDFVANFVVK